MTPRRKTQRPLHCRACRRRVRKSIDPPRPHRQWKAHGPTYLCMFPMYGRADGTARGSVVFRARGDRPRNPPRRPHARARAHATGTRRSGAHAHMARGGILSPFARAPRAGDATLLIGLVGHAHGVHTASGRRGTISILYAHAPPRDRHTS